MAKKPADKGAVSAASWPATKIEMWPVEDLVPYVGNARLHPPEQVEQIAASMRRFAMTSALLVEEDGTIIAGHGRLEAAKSLGMTEVPVIRLPSLTETQRQALVITDNQLALNAGWDEVALSTLLRDLDAKDYNLDLLGFSSEDLERYMASLDGDLIDGETEPPIPDVPVVPVSQPGDLWILGPHRVLCGDATVLTDVEKLMDGQLADMAFLDPPYNVDYANAAKDKKRSKDRRILNDALGGDFGPFLQTVCSNVLAVTKGACYICMSSSELHTLQKAWVDAGGKWSTFVIWAKTTVTLGRSDYQRLYEPILYGSKQGRTMTGAGPRIRTMSGSLASRRSTACIRP